MDLDIIATPDLGDRTYIVAAGDRAAVIDPQRDIDRVLATLERRDLRLELVLETHIHNDYVTGGWALASDAGAIYGVAAADEVSYHRTPLSPGDELDLGTARIRVLATPGHTPTHLAFAYIEDGAPLAIFTGGSLLYGTVGRTDLISPDMTEHLTRSQYRSVMTLLRDHDAPVAVYPTHGFGSFCASGGATGADTSTIGIERRVNLAAQAADEDEFVATVITGLGPYPAYYPNMAPINRSGPQAFTDGPLPSLDAESLRDRGGWLVDLRDRRRFAAAHDTGRFNFEAGDSMATYLGWAMPWGTPLGLIGESDAQLRAARRSLARIGIEPEGTAILDEAGDRSYRVVTWPDVAEVADRDDVVLLDTRQPDEFEDGHLAGAVNIPFYELAGRTTEVPPGDVWVYCRSGYRASVAASMLDAAGRRVVLVDDDWEKASRSGLGIDQDLTIKK